MQIIITNKKDYFENIKNYFFAQIAIISCMNAILNDVKHIENFPEKK